MDLGFEQLLAEHQEAFKDSEVYSNWMPPDGNYIVSVSKFESGEKAKDGARTAWYKLSGKIEVEKDPLQDVKLGGREFLINFYRSSAYGILKGDARLISGDPSLDDLKEAYEVLEASIGTVLAVKVETAFSDKFKKNFTNCYIQEVLKTTTASAEVVDIDPATVQQAEVPVEEATTQELIEAPPEVV